MLERFLFPLIRIHNIQKINVCMNCDIHLLVLHIMKIHIYSFLYWRIEEKLKYTHRNEYFSFVLQHQP